MASPSPEWRRRFEVLPPGGLAWEMVELTMKDVSFICGLWMFMGIQPKISDKKM